MDSSLAVINNPAEQEIMKQLESATPEQAFWCERVASHSGQDEVDSLVGCGGCSQCAGCA